MTVPNPTATGARAPGPPGKTRLIKVPSGDKHIDTGNQECDIRLALSRGLAEYLEQLIYRAQGGQRRVFATVHDEWAEPEENAQFPTAVVYPRQVGTYEGRALTPAVNPRQRLPPPDGRYLVIPSEFSVDLLVEVWANDPEQRTDLLIMLEQALNPVYWRSGFVLELPHYFNVRATYVVTTLEIPDSPDKALQRFRVAGVTVRAQGPVVVLYTFPDFKPQFDLRAIGPNVDVTPDSAIFNVVSTDP